MSLKGQSDLPTFGTCDRSCAGQKECTGLGRLRSNGTQPAV